MGRILIVANQTLGGTELDRVVRDRITRGSTDFYILVPVTPPGHEAATWRRGFEVRASEAVTRPGGVALTEEGAGSDHSARDMEESARRHQTLADEAYDRAEARLGQMVDRVGSAGGQAHGEVGDADPAAAVGRVLEREAFDEIVLSTLPSGISRWLRMDVSSRISRMTHTPVTTVEAETEE